jgi:hypothetical protein
MKFFTKPNELSLREKALSDGLPILNVLAQECLARAFTGKRAWKWELLPGLFLV